MSQSNTVTLTINQKPVTVPAGSTIIQAAIQSGVQVPHFCWHPGLSIAGVCRFCMVRVEGMPKLQIACNTTVSEGMKVDTLGEDVKEAHKWALEFHLINHPLDCPICDQAGECELQNYYMKVGKYKSQMVEDKVLKPKTIPISSTLVLDTERCILCSRCVRFEDEVTKTSGLGIFSRGDKATIGAYAERKIQHNYTYNLADVCPVGAFTASDFRFKCRVWFLKELDAICPGCSAGCNVKVSLNQNQREDFRLKPRPNAQVNGHWMCDTGRTMYKHCNASQRLATPTQLGVGVDWQKALSLLKGTLHSPSKLAVVLTAQYTTEEYKALKGFLGAQAGLEVSYYWWQDPAHAMDAFDGILQRGDSNPNTFGLLEVFGKNLSENSSLCRGDFSSLARLKPDSVWVFGPEIDAAFPGLNAALTALTELPKLVYFGNSLTPVLQKAWLQLPTKVFTEKSGTFSNFSGLAQKGQMTAPVMVHARAVDEVLAVLSPLDSSSPTNRGER